jgi:hypothetical protein
MHFVAVGGLYEEVSFDGLNMNHVIFGISQEYLIVKKPGLFLDGLSCKKRFLGHGGNS